VAAASAEGAVGAARSATGTAGEDEAFLEELAKVAEEDLECELPKAHIPKAPKSRSFELGCESDRTAELEIARNHTATLERQCQLLAQAVQSLKDQQAAEAARVSALLGRVEGLEAENRTLREAAVPKDS